MQKLSLYIIILLLQYSNVNGQIDTINTKFAEWKKIYNEAKMDYFDSVALSFGLPALKGSADSFSLRLWEHSMFGYSLNTIVLHNNTLSSRKYIKWGQHKLEETKISSKYSLNSIFDSLKNYKFNEIPDQMDIKDMQFSVDDGETFILEIITKGNYYNWRYENPGYYVRNYPATKPFAEMMALLNNYFNSK